MTLVQAPLLTSGASHSAQTFRMMVRDLARGNEGVTEGNDLKVTELGTPGASVQVGDGSGVIRGRANTFQGHYNAYNLGAASVAIAATGGSPRTDMVVLRVEDPAYEGTLNPAVDPICYFHVVSGVSSTATDPPAGMTAIPLARITIPASTSVITNSMITDIRRIANPRRERNQYIYNHPGPLEEISGTSETWKTHPLLSGASPAGAMFNVPIPSWAAKAIVVFTAGCIRLDTGTVFGGFRFQLGSKEASQWVNIDDNQGTGARRLHAIVQGETIDLTDVAGAAMRGTTQAFKSRMRTRSTNAGKIGVDSETVFHADIEFIEGVL